jgi:hypothetical protein
VTSSMQIVEAGWPSGRMTAGIDLPAPAVEHGAPVGAAAGRWVVAAAVGEAAGPAHRRAGELLALVRHADRTEAVYRKQEADIGRQIAAWAGVPAGPAAVAAFAALEDLRAMAVKLHVGAALRRDRALKELQSIRYAAAARPVAVTAALDDRQKAAEREQAAARLVGTTAKPLARVLTLDAEAEKGVPETALLQCLGRTG